MVKLALSMLLAVFVCQGYSSPLINNNDVNMAAARGDWSEVQRIIQQYANSRAGSSTQVHRDFPQGSSSATLENTPGGRYYSQSEYSYQRQSNNNGVVSEDKGGLGRIDDNGRISFYKPNPSSYAQIQRQPISGNYGSSLYGQGR